VPVLVPRRSVELSDLKGRTFISVPVTLDPLTASLEVRLRRPTTLIPLSWDVTGRVEVSLVVVADGVEHRCVGSTSGGIRIGIGGKEIADYVLRYTTTWGFFGARAGAAKRLGEGKASYQARLEMRLVSGTVATEIAVTNEVFPAPDMPFRSSVAFDAATDGIEISGDGVFSLTHTAGGGAGSNRAVFAGNNGFGQGAGRPTTSIQYGGTGMSEKWDASESAVANLYNAGYTLALGDTLTGAQTVTATTETPVDYQFLHVISMTGVDQTTPVGTPAFDTAADTTSPASRTVGSVGADDLVVDSLIWWGSVAPTVGADQTVRNTHDDSGVNFFRGSTQPGLAGGVMSWSATGIIGAMLGAIAFKPAAAGGAAVTPNVGAAVLVGAAPSRVIGTILTPATP